MTITFTPVCLRHLWKCCTLNHGNCQNFSNSWIWFQTDIHPPWKPYNTSAAHSCSSAIRNEGETKCLFTFAAVLELGLSWEESYNNKKTVTLRPTTLIPHTIPDTDWPSTGKFTVFWLCKNSSKEYMYILYLFLQVLCHRGTRTCCIFYRVWTVFAVSF